jgi:hypothetical protein
MTTSIVIGINELTSNSYMSDGTVIYQLADQEYCQSLLTDAISDGWEECEESNENISVQSPGLKNAKESGVDCYCQLYKKVNDMGEVDYQEWFIADDGSDPASALSKFIDEYC